MHPQLGAGASQPQLGAGSQQLFGAHLLLILAIRSLRQLLRAGLQHVGAGASHPQLGATSHPQLGAGAGAAQGAGAGAAQHVGAGAAHGAGASQQVGAGSQQLLFFAQSLLIIPLILLPNFGLQAGAGSQHVGAGASQHVGAGASQQVGAGSQQAFFLQNKPAEALEDEIAAQTTTVKVTINRRILLTPKQKF